MPRGGAAAAAAAYIVTEDQRAEAPKGVHEGSGGGSSWEEGGEAALLPPLPGATASETQSKPTNGAAEGRKRNLTRSQSKSSIGVDLMAGALRARSYTLGKDTMNEIAASTIRSDWAEVWRSVGVKASMMGALKGLNMDNRAIYGDDIGGVGDMLGRAAHDHEKWSQTMGGAVSDVVVGSGTLRCFLLSPECRFRRVWDATQVLLLLYVAITVPLRFAFNIDSELLSFAWWWEVLVDLYFITDIVLNFRTGYVNDVHQLIMDPKLIRRRYLMGWFSIDAVSCLPIGYVQALLGGGDGDGAGSSMKAFKTLRLFRLAKLLRLARLRQIIKRWEETIGSMMSILKLVVLLLVVLFMTHVIACMWYFTGDMDGGWVHTWKDELDADGKGAQNYTSWGQHEILHKYLRTYYWGVGLVSSSARGDIPPGTNGEMLFVILCEVVGTVTCGVILGTLSSMFMATRLLEEKVDRELAELREFLEVKRIPKKVRNRVRRYMEHLYRRKTGYDEQELLERLPPALASELLSHLYKSQLENVPLFSGLSDVLLSKLCLTMKPLKIMKHDFVYQEGEICREFYVIESGQVEVSRYEVLLARLGDGAAFGEEALRPGHQKRSRSALAIVDCDLMMITQDDLHAVSSSYDELKERLDEVYNRRRKKEEQRLKDMMNETAKRLGVHADSAVMAKILERTERMVVEMAKEKAAQEQAEMAVEDLKTANTAPDSSSSVSGEGRSSTTIISQAAVDTDRARLALAAAREEAAVRISRHYRGYRCRRAQKQMAAAEMVKEEVIEAQAAAILQGIQGAPLQNESDEDDDADADEGAASEEREPTLREVANQLQSVMNAVASLQIQLEAGLREVRNVAKNQPEHHLEHGAPNPSALRNNHETILTHKEEEQEQHDAEVDSGSGNSSDLSPRQDKHVHFNA